MKNLLIGGGILYPLPTTEMRKMKILLIAEGYATPLLTTEGGVGVIIISNGLN
jgi:hypothetical protein